MKGFVYGGIFLSGSPDLINPPGMHRRVTVVVSVCVCLSVG